MTKPAAAQQRTLINLPAIDRNGNDIDLLFEESYVLGEGSFGKVVRCVLLRAYRHVPNTSHNAKLK